MSTWNPWHGCTKISPGCLNCYVYRTDAKFGKDSCVVRKTKEFDLPLKCDKYREWKLQPENGAVFTCFTSDFWLDEADVWRKEIWAIIKRRSDLKFFIITKRIHRFYESLPDDWGNGYENVSIGCTVENQCMCNFRLPIFNNLPIRHKTIICEPLLEKLNISDFINKDIEMVVVGGESGTNARICNFDWILNIRDQCLDKKVDFCFRQTGAKFVKDKIMYNIPRYLQLRQAEKADINISFGGKG